LVAEIDMLGTNLLTVTNGQTLLGQNAELPNDAPRMISRLAPVTEVEYTGSVNAKIYRSPLIPRIDTNALSVRAASLGLLPTVGTSVAEGRFLNAATAQEPVVVLGAAAARRLGIDRVFAGERIWLGGQWFYVAGILKPALLAPEIDTAALIGFPAAKAYLGFDGHPSKIYVRAEPSHVALVQSVLAAMANPRHPTKSM
jgi:putative ABC transport system permease protein